jgi:hypothetical protein
MPKSISPVTFSVIVENVPLTAEAKKRVEKAIKAVVLKELAKQQVKVKPLSAAPQARGIPRFGGHTMGMYVMQDGGGI